MVFVCDIKIGRLLPPSRFISDTGDWSNGMIGVSKTFGGSSILSSPALAQSAEHSELTYFIIRKFVCFVAKIITKEPGSWNCLKEDPIIVKTDFPER